MEKSTDRNVNLLNRIRFGFERQRRNGRFSASDELKQLTQTARDAGYSLQEIARAAQVTTRSIVNWTAGKRARRRPTTAPLELTLIESPPSVAVTHVHDNLDAAAQSPESLASIRFRSGIILQVPIVALNSHLVDILNRSPS